MTGTLQIGCQMVEKKKSFGSKKGGFKPRAGARSGARPSDRKRAEGRQPSSNYRSPVPRKAGVPTAAVAAIVIPCVVIIFLLFFGSSFFTSAPEVVVNDPNTRIRSLERKVKSFQDEWRRVRKLLIADSDGGEASAERLSDRMQDWLVEWNEEMKPYQDADGYLKEGFKGYSRTRSEVSRILYDLNKSKGF